MHGLINQAIERFARDTYGDDAWEALTRRIDLGFCEFEAMLRYDDQVTEAVLNGLTEALGKSREDLLEDIGTYLVSHPNAHAVRRLLRFGGADFVEFLHSLDDLPARGRLAVPDLELPQLVLREHTGQQFALTVVAPRPGGFRFGHVVIGLLRAMADDFGALVFVDHKGARDGCEIIEIALLEAAFAEARDFNLGARTA